MATPEFEACMQVIAQCSARMDERRARNQERRAEITRELARDHEEIVEQRRKGECGRAWQVLQQRIDMNQTCEQDIFGGIDKSPEAREVRKTMGEHMAKLTAYMYDEDNADTEIGRSLAAMNSAMDRLHEQERTVQQMQRAMRRE